MLAKLLSSDGYIPVNKHLGRAIGTNEALLLGELIRQRERFGQDEFYINQPDLSYETTLSVDQIKSAGKKLKELGLVGIVKKGSPGTNHYVINDIAVMELFTNQLVENPLTSEGKSHGQVRGKRSNIYIDNKKQREKNNKGDVIYFQDKSLNKAFHDFLEDRKKRGKKATDKAIEMLVKELNELSNNVETQIAIINQSIKKSYTSFYPLKTNNGRPSGNDAQKKEPSNAFHNQEGTNNQERLAQQGYPAQVISSGGDQQ